MQSIRRPLAAATPRCRPARRVRNGGRRRQRRRAASPSRRITARRRPSPVTGRRSGCVQRAPRGFRRPGMRPAPGPGGRRPSRSRETGLALARRPPRQAQDRPAGKGPFASRRTSASSSRGATRPTERRLRSTRSAACTRRLQRSQNIWYDSYCSGTLVAPNIVLTAAHCVREGRPDGVKFHSFTFAPAVNGTSRPHGTFQSRATRRRRRRGSRPLLQLGGDRPGRLLRPGLRVRGARP